MTKDAITRMAREAGAIDMTINGWTTWVGTQSTEYLERFAALVAAAEREACARVVDGYFGANTIAAAAIRARGEK